MSRPLKNYLWGLVKFHTGSNSCIRICLALSRESLRTEFLFSRSGETPEPTVKQVFQKHSVFESKLSIANLKQASNDTCL